MRTDHAHQLRVAIAAHAGLQSDVVERPLPGLALILPEGMQGLSLALSVAAAIDAEQTTTGFVTFDGRPAVALPADPACAGQVAHAVAKVVHVLLGHHTPYISAQEAASCPLPASPVAEVAADQVLTRAGALIDAIVDYRATTGSPGLDAVVDEALDLVAQTISPAHA